MIRLMALLILLTAVPAAADIYKCIVGLHALVWADLWRGGALSGAFLKWVRALV